MLYSLLLVTVAACVLMAEAGPNYRAMFLSAMDEFAAKDGILMNESPKVRAERYKSFKKFAQKVEAVNDNPDIPFECKNNEFSVMTSAERNTHLGLNISAVAMKPDERNLDKRGNWNEMWYDVPKGVSFMKRDFRARGVPDIKNQGGCGSCWTFGAAASLEAEMLFESGKLPVLAEQEYLDCVDTGSDGCNGGFMTFAYKYNSDSGRMGAKNDIPYQGKDYQRCSYSGKANAFSGRDNDGTYQVVVAGNIVVPTQDVSAETFKYNVRAAASNHVLSVAIHASDVFMAYKSGVLEDSTSGTANHAVNIVGFGTDSTSGRNYWLIRNSWGTGWGKSGYIYVARDFGYDHIALRTYVHFPLVKCTHSTKGSCTRVSPNTVDDTSGGDDAGDDKSECDASKGFFKCPSKEYKCMHCHMCEEYKNNAACNSDNSDDSSDGGDNSGMAGKRIKVSFEGILKTLSGFY